MLIGQVAAAAGVSVRMVRHYADQGLVSAERGSNGYRVFADDDVPRVRQIKVLLDLGLTTAEVRELAPCLNGQPGAPQCAETQAALRRHIDAIDASVRDLLALRSRLASSVGG